ncbi:MAG: AAA family ATPase [Clostridia bacterium]
MTKKHIITIAGELGSGKSSVADLLKEELNYEIYRNGEYFRSLAKKNGMSVKDFNIYVKQHPQIDRDIEKSAQLYAQEHDNLIIDARLGWYAVPNSFKVYLTVDTDVAASRAFEDEKRKETESFNSVEEQKKDMIERYKLENDRYFVLYKIHKEDVSNYDFILDTTNLTLLEVKNKIIIAYTTWLEKSLI